MNNKILTTVLATLLIVSNTGVITYFNMEVDKKEKQISKYKEDIKTKSTEIAKLSDIVEEKKKLIINKNMVIEKDRQLLASNDKTIEDLKAKLSQKDVQIQELKKKVNNAEKKYDMTFTASAYTNHPSENGIYGGKVLTRTGYDITNSTRYQGYGIVASDTGVLPLHSIIEIEGLSGQYIILDTGSAIVGNKLDVLMNSKSEAFSWGKRSVGVKIIRRGR